MTAKITITRKTIIGYAVNTTPDRDGKFEYPQSHEVTGTVRTLSEKIRSDRFYNSLTSTYYSDAYFARIDGKWHRITDRDLSGKLSELESKYNNGFGDEYITDSVSVSVE